MPAGAFDQYFIYDVLRVIEVVLAVGLAGMLVYVSLTRGDYRIPRWLMLLFLSLSSFIVASALNGVGQLGMPLTPRLFFNMSGILLGLWATSVFRVEELRHRGRIGYRIDAHGLDIEDLRTDMFQIHRAIEQAVARSEELGLHPESPPTDRQRRQRRSAE